jgi:O-antigen/teichoic acid export membrane protein
MKLLQDKIFSETVIVTLGIFSSSIFSYILQVALSRFFSVAEYGLFNTLLSFSYLVTVPISVLILSLIKVVAELKALDDLIRLKKMFYVVVGICFIIACVISMIFALGANFLASFLRISDPFYIVVFGDRFMMWHADRRRFDKAIPCATFGTLSRPFTKVCATLLAYVG